MGHEPSSSQGDTKSCHVAAQTSLIHARQASSARDSCLQAVPSMFSQLMLKAHRPLIAQRYALPFLDEEVPL